METGSSHRVGGNVGGAIIGLTELIGWDILELTQMKKKRLFNRDNIKWSPNMAYAIGLITTDGNLSPDGRHIIFVSKDVDLIKTFKCCLGLNNRITSKTSGYSNRMYNKIQFGNVKFYRWLLKIGLMPNKTKIIGKLNLPNKYMPDFLRGHLDGDGCIRVYQDPIYPNSQRLYTRFLSASLPHVLWLRKRIVSLLKIEGHMSPHIKGVFELNYAKNESKILLNAIYYNKSVPCLKRKRKIAESFLNICRGGGIGDTR